jgi:hypothetical protein
VEHLLDEPGLEKLPQLRSDSPSPLLVEAAEPLLHVAGVRQDVKGVLGDLPRDVLTDKRRIPLRSASVRTPHLFHHGIPKVLVNPRSKGITSVRSTTTH